MTDFRVCNTDDLKAMADEALRWEFNRAPHLPEHLDPEGTHVLNRVLYGHNMDRGMVPLHHRCRVLAKVSGSTVPVEIDLDVTDANWQMLHRPETVLGAA